MPTIPDYTAVGTSTPQSQRSIVMAPQSAAHGAGELIGNTMIKTGMAAYEQQDRNEYIKARSEYHRTKIKTLAEIEQGEFEGDDAQNYYETQMSEARAAGSKNILGSSRLAAFESDADYSLERGRIETDAIVFRQQGTKSVAELGTLINDNLQAASFAQDPEESRALLEVSMDAIETNREAGFIDDIKAAALKRDMAVDYAVMGIDALPPRDQIARLNDPKDPYAKLIPVDTRNRMIASAENEAAIYDADAEAESIIATGGTLNQQLDKVRDIADPKVEKLVRQHVTSVYNQRNAADREEVGEIYDQVDKAILDGQSTLSWSKDNSTAWDRLSGNDQRALMTLESKAGADVESNLDVIDSLNLEIYRSKDPVAARQYYLENKDKLSRADRKTYSKLTLDMEKPEQMDGLYTLSQRISHDIKSTEMSKKEGGALQKWGQEGYLKYKRDNDGAEPDAAAVDAIMDRAYEQVTVERWGPNKDIERYKLAPDDKLEVPDEERALIILSLKRSGTLVNEDNIERKYRAYRLSN